MSQKAEPLGLEHRELIAKFVDAHPNDLSEYSFLNLYLFRKEHDYKAALYGDLPFIIGTTYDKKSFITPLFDPAGLSSGELKRLADGYDFIFPVDEKDLSRYDPDAFSRTFSRDDSDYVYSTSDLAALKGHHLQKTRNKERRFLREHAFEISILGPHSIGDAGTVLERWKAGRDSAVKESDYLPCLEALELFEHIGLHGFIVYADSRPAGFVIWEERPGAMPIALFEKADNDGFSGVTQFMFSHLAELLKSKFTYFNMCQDMGIQSLRFSKTELNPAMLLNKYRLTSNPGFLNA